jgi:hypothetical protein
MMSDRMCKFKLLRLSIELLSNKEKENGKRSKGSYGTKEGKGHLQG